MRMKMPCGLLLVLSCGLCGRPALAASPSDYPIKIQVTSSELKNVCVTDTKGSDCGLHQLLAVTIDTKKYQLESSRVRPRVLIPGDYQARITKDEKKDSSEYFREYEVIFPDRKTVKYIVVGEFE